MPSPRSRSFSFVVAVAVASAASAAFAACTSNGNVVIDDDASTSSRDGGTSIDSAIPKRDSATADDSSTGYDPSKVCAQELAYLQACGVEAKDVNCTATGFEAWCKENQTKVDSEQRARARAQCLVAPNCASRDRNACIYDVYNTLTLGPAQQKLVADYCQTCEPGVATCTTTKSRYDSSAGPASVDDIYIAAWELAEPLVNEIDRKCTGAAFADAGADAGTCAKRFAACAGDVYVDALPDCPK